MSTPKEQFCDYCGEPMGVFKWSRSIDGPLSCGSAECSRMEREDHAARDAEARFAAEEDGYSRYGGSGWALAFAALLSLFASVVSAQTITGPARVVDGDTLEIQGQKVRLHGVDAPEIRQTCARPEFNGHTRRVEEGSPWPCGVAARRRIEEVIDSRPVTCRALDKDRYCFVGAPHIDLSGWLVRNGLAVAYTKYSRDYVPQETAARGARLGIWSGAFVPPAEWRKGVRAPGPRPGPGSGRLP
jgi:endonuclease YncB( thermonuclease family)